jgi:hypothetical protein
LGRTTVQDEATMLKTAGGKAGGSGAPEAGEDGAGKEDGVAAAEPRRPGQVGEEAARVPGADGGGPAVWRGARASAEAGGGGEFCGAEDGGRHRRRRSGRMTAAAEDEDTTMTMTADR